MWACDVLVGIVFLFQAEDGIRDIGVTGVQTCALPIFIHGVETRVLAPEELVTSKIFVAKRERFDGADIAHIIYSTYPSFDWDRELQLAGEHWEMVLWSPLLFRYVYPAQTHYVPRSEEHTSELQSRQYLLCRLLLEKE